MTIHISKFTFTIHISPVSGYQSSQELSTNCWTLHMRSYRDWHQFISSALGNILAALNEFDQQTTIFSFDQNQPRRQKLFCRCGEVVEWPATTNCCWGHWTRLWNGLPQLTAAEDTGQDKVVEWPATTNCCWGHWTLGYSTRPLGSSASTAVGTGRRSINPEHYY
jgi:hypothetical protein